MLEKIELRQKLKEISIFLGVTDRNHLVEYIPHELHDISMDGLITHDEFIEINI